MEAGHLTRSSSVYDRNSADQPRSATDSLADRYRWQIPISPIQEQSSSSRSEAYGVGLSPPRPPPPPPGASRAEGTQAGIGSTRPPPAPPGPNPQILQKENEDEINAGQDKICGLGFRAFWIVLILLTLLIATGLGIGLGLGIGNARSVCNMYELESSQCILKPCLSWGF